MGQTTGITLQPQAVDPLYRQLFDQIVRRIRSGTFPPGYQLPPTRALAGELQAHRNTVVRAYEDLEAAGFVHSTVGKGTFVAEQARGERGGGGDGDGGDGGDGGGPARRGLPWSTLLSSAALVEPLHRASRIGGRGVTPAGDTVLLNRMQPSAELLPDDLLRRCIDHVLRTLGPRALGYTPREGLPRLRALVAEDLRRQGVPAAAEDLIITTGSQQALDVVARALINPGDTFLVDESTYVGALNLLSVAGARLIGVPADDEGPDMATLERHGRTGAKGLYVMPNCHNPTGARVSTARREALVAWSHQTGVPLIEDDYASDLHLDGQPALPAMRTLDGEVIYIGTYSKKLIPALRIGYLLAPRALVPHLGALKHAMDLGTSTLLQHALAEFLERGYLRAHLGRVLAEYRRRLGALETALGRYLPSEVRWRRPETGVALWLPVPASLDAVQIFEEAERQGVLVSPGDLNGVSARPQQAGLRLTFCAEPPERLAEGARRLGRAWATVEKRTRKQSGAGAPPVMETI